MYLENNINNTCTCINHSNNLGRNVEMKNYLTMSKHLDAVVVVVGGAER